jgi:hypothetical protein
MTDTNGLVAFLADRHTEDTHQAMRPGATGDAERALAEIDARHAILEHCAGAIDNPGLLGDALAMKGLLHQVERLLASVYRSHPDWREDWAA